MVRELAPESSQDLQITQYHTSEISGNTDNMVNIVLMSFEPFTENENSTCWDILRLLTDDGITFKRPVNVHCYKLRNIYDFIAKQISRSWQKHKPDIVVIVGQHEFGDANELWFEQFSSNIHVLSDRSNRLARKDCCTFNGPPYINTYFNLESLVKKLKTQDNPKIMGKVAKTLGGYFLCEYAYYNSLFIDPARTLCVRFPQKSASSTQDFAGALSLSIIELLSQLEMKQLL